MTCVKHTMFSPTKVSFVTLQNLVIDVRRYFPCHKFKRGRVSNKRWSADHDLLATDTLASLVDTLALITRCISFLKDGRAAATVNVSEFRRDIYCVWDRLCGLVSGQEFLATDPEARVRFPALPDFLEKKKRKKVVGLERGPLSLVSTTEELLDRKVAAPV
jgi:hypothetical protein